MIDVERVARAWNEEHERWSVRECGDVWAIYRQDGDAADEIGCIRSMLGADKRMFRLRDIACARAVLTALRTPGPAVIAAIGRHVPRNLPDAYCAALVGVIVDAILGETEV